MEFNVKNSNFYPCGLQVDLTTAQDEGKAFDFVQTYVIINGTRIRVKCDDKYKKYLYKLAVQKGDKNDRVND